MKASVLAALLSALVAVLFVVSLLTGPAGLGVGTSLGALLSGGGDATALVMREIRLPRAILAVAIGAALGVSGAALQGYLRNPLAEPGLIGVSGGAALGAVIALQSGLAASFALALPLAGLAGALGAVTILLGLAAGRGGALSLILAGIAVSALAGALTSLVLNLSPNPFAATEIVFWTLGSLADRSFIHVWLAVPLIVLGSGVVLLQARALDALTLGEDAAQALGINLARVRLAIVLGTAAAVGAATSVAGAIGFVGLVVPHVLRPLVGARPGRLLWASGLGGAALVLAADIAVRVVLPEKDLKLGVVMALIGAPLFFHLIRSTGGERA